MEEKYIKFYKTFHKKFKNDKNLIHCFELLSDGGIINNSDLWESVGGIYRVCIRDSGTGGIYQGRKTGKDSERKRSSGGGLQRRMNHCSEIVSDGGINFGI